MNMRRSSNVLLQVLIRFCRRQIAYDPTDVNEDMKMFEMPGLNHKAFTKVSQPATVEAVDLQFENL
jgi:hypothetical protein